MIEALSLDLDWIPTDLNRLLTSSANNRVRTNAAEAPAITVIQFQSSAYFLARTLGPLAATGTPARTDELLEKKLKQILAASLPAIKHKISISRLQDYDAGKPETQLTFKYYQEVTHLLWPHLPKIEQLQGTSRNTCLDASTSCITFFGQIIDDHIASLQALDNPQSTLQRDLLPSFMTLKRALEQVRLHLPPRAPLDADQALHSTFDSASGSDNLLEEQIEVVLTSSAEVTPKLQNVATDEHFKELIGKINQLLPSKESIEAAKQEKKFDKINKALDTGKKLGVLAGSIAAYCGDAQTGEQIELIVGSTVEIGLALVAAYTGGPIGWVNAGITVVGTVLKILNFYNKPKTPSAEEIISSQIAHLSEQVNQHFKQVETMLSEMYKDVFTWFSSLREDIRRLDREIKDVRGKLDPIHAKIEALFTKEYFDNRFNALSFHQLFDQDMNLDDQIRYFQVFRNCALLDSQRHANQPDQRGIVNQLKDPIDGGMERNIPVLVDYARRYLGFNGVRPDECINPLFWAEGGLSLIEFFDRTPEFNLTPKIKAGCDEILEEGRKFNQLTASLHTLGVVRRVVELYSASLDELLATLGNMPAPDEPFHKVEDSFFENTFRAGVGHYYTYDHYVTYRDKLIERLKTSDDLLQEVEKAHVLTLTFFALCYREQFLYDPDVRACLAALWNAAQVREWLQSYQNAVYGSTIATVQAYHTQLKQQYYGGTQLEKYDVYQAVKLRFGLIEQLKLKLLTLKRPIFRLLAYSAPARVVNTDFPIVGYTVAAYNDFFKRSFSTVPSQAEPARAVTRTEPVHTFAIDLTTAQVSCSPHTAIQHDAALKWYQPGGTSWELATNGTFSVTFEIDGEVTQPLLLKVVHRSKHTWDQYRTLLSLQLNDTQTIVQKFFPVLEYDGFYGWEPAYTAKYRYDDWVLPTAALRSGTNTLRFQVAGGIGYWVQSIELCSSIGTPAVETIAFYSPAAQKYIGVYETEDMPLGAFKTTVDAWCYFRKEPKLSEEIVRLYSPSGGAYVAQDYFNPNDALRVLKKIKRGGATTEQDLAVLSGMGRFRIFQHEDGTVSLYAINLKRYLSVDPGDWKLKASKLAPDEWCRFRIEYKPAST